MPNSPITTSLSYLMGAVSLLHNAIASKNKEDIAYQIAYLNLCLEDYMGDEGIEIKGSYIDLAEIELAETKRKGEARYILVYDTDEEEETD